MVERLFGIGVGQMQLGPLYLYTTWALLFCYFRATEDAATTLVLYNGGDNYHATSAI